MKRFRARVAARAAARQSASGGAVVVDVWLNAVGVVTTLAGSGSGFNRPFGVAVLSNGNTVVTDTDNHRIRLVTPAGVVTTLAGDGTGAFLDDTGTGARFWYPFGLAVLPNGNIVVADAANHRIRLITMPGAVVTTLAGNGTPAFLDGTGTGARFNGPRGVAILSNGNIVVVEDGNNCVRLVTPAGVVTTLAGNGTPAFADGTGTGARFNSPLGVNVLPNDTIVVADTYNQRIRLVTPAGVVTTLAGSSQGSTDGTGTGASFYNPFGVIALPNGNLVVTDWYNHRLRLITPAGVVTTFAGNGTPALVNASGTSASFNRPAGLALFPNGTIVVGDDGNNSIRLITPTPVLPVPLYYEVTPTNWTNSWQPYLQQLTTGNANAAVSFSSSGITGSTPTGYAYIGGVLAPNGKIYCITCLATTIGVIDPIANTLTYPVSGTVIGNDAYDAGGVLGPDGKIYCIPFNTAPVGVIDPTANTFTTFGTSVSGVLYCGGVLAPNGKIYCIPFNGSAVGVIDPLALTLTSPVTGTAPGSSAYYCGVLAPNGKIYCIPYNATSVGVIDPVANTFTTPLSGSSPGSTAYNGGVLAPNGKIYCIPRSANTIGVIDPVANTFSTTSVSGTKPSGYVYFGGALAPNGKIYLVPRYATDSANSIGVIDPVANTFTTIGGASSSDSYAGAVLAPNGKIYFIPWQASTPAVLTISCSQLPSSNYCLSAYANKF